MAEVQDQVNPMYSFYMELSIDGMNIQSSNKFSCAALTRNYVMKSFHDLVNSIESLEQLLTKLKCAGLSHALINTEEQVQPMQVQ